MANGKGDRQRGDREARKKYAEGWDAIFGKKPPSPFQKRMKRVGRQMAEGMRKKPKPYPVWVCSPCGSQVSKRKGGWLATWHTGRCDVCGEVRMVTEPRDFGYPDFPGHVTRAELTARWLRTLSPENRALFEAMKSERLE